MKHSPLLLPLATLAALAALAACQPKTAATNPTDNSPPVAKVNGTPISRNLYEFYIKRATGKTSTDLSPQERSQALDNLIRGQVVADQAVKQGLDKGDDVPYVLELQRLGVLEQAVAENYLKDKKPTDQELRTEYETQLTTMPKSEYHVRHILVATEPFAEKIIQRLEKGEKFEDLASKESMDPSKSKGGDLGWITPQRLPEFAAPLATLEPGEYTRKPVQTQYGWHIIQLVETRELTPPPFDQVKNQLGQSVEAKKFHNYTDELMTNAKIEKSLEQPPAATSGGVPKPPPGPSGGAAAPTSPPPPAAAPPAPPKK